MLSCMSRLIFTCPKIDRCCITVCHILPVMIYCLIYCIFILSMKNYDFTFQSSVFVVVSVLCDWMFTGLYCYNLHVLQLLDLCNFWCCNCCVAISWSYLQSGLLIVSIYFLKCNSYKWLSNQELLPNTPISSTDGLIW